MVTNSVFNLRCLRLRSGAIAHVFLEILIEYRDWLDLNVNSPRFKKGIRDLPQFWRNALHTQTRIPEMLPRKNIDLQQRLVFRHEIQRLLGRKHHVQTPRISLEERHELKAQILVVEEVKESVVIGEIGQPLLLEELNDRIPACSQCPQFLFGKTQRVEHILLFTLIVGI